jgi:hypothetical protein
MLCSGVSNDRENAVLGEDGQIKEDIGYLEL